ncbi:MAG: PcfJ domain-containing protein, partial [Clostridia bacterium]
DMCYTYIGGYIVGWFSEGLQKCRKWYESDDWGWNEDNLFDPYAPIVNKEYLAKFAEYKYAAWELYNGIDILQYLRLYEQYPQVEYLAKLGLVNYVSSKQILEKTTADKAFCKWLGKHRDELQSSQIYVTTILQAYSKNKPIAEIQALEKAKKELRYNERYKEMREFIGKDKEKFLAYLGKQQTGISSYADYLKACNYLGVDMTVDKNRYPHDFKRWHDIRIDEYHTAKAVADEKERQELYEKFEQVAEKYITLEKLINAKNNDYNFVAIIAKSPQDLILEGEKLHHCVGRMNYDQKFIREETLIFFIRNKQSPDIPLVTVEYSLQSRKVLQCYGDNDTKPDDTVATFVNKLWLPYANKQVKKLQKVA